MNILLICSDLGKTAPGKVYQTIVNEFSKKDNITVIAETFNCDSTLFNQVEVNYKLNNRRIIKLLISIFGFNIFDYLWALKCYKKVKNKQYDLIISCLSYHHYNALVCGNYISNKINVKHICYSVDAVPAPEGWGEPLYYVRGVKRFINKNLSKVDEFYSSNPKMLAYQKELFNSKSIKTGVIYTPVDSNKIINEAVDKNDDSIILLYTGSFYGARNPKYLFDAFRKLLNVYPHAILRFIGTKFSSGFLENYQDVIKNIEILPYQTDLNKFYNEATILIDVDAELKDDVFLSSKITNYIFVNKPILAQTSINSPSYQLFKNLNSIFIVDHDTNNIYNYLIKIIENKNIDYNERIPLKELFIFQKNIICK